MTVWHSTEKSAPERAGSAEAIATPGTFARREVPFVGRQRDLAVLWGRFEAAAGSQPSAVLVGGEPGIGKTRLLDEFAARATAAGAIVLRGGASEAEGMPPYLPFLEALGRYIRTAEVARLREQVGFSAAPLAALFPELTARLGELPSGYPLPAEQARLRLYEAVGEFLKAIAAPQPLVLLFDDLHWADSASLDLLCHVMRRQADIPMLLVGAYQEGPAAHNLALRRALADLTRLRRLTTLALGPLSSDEVSAVATHLLGRPVDRKLRRLLYAQSEGNPFFAEELLAGWLEAGTANDKHHGGRRENPLPAGLSAALQMRLAELPPPVVDDLRVAALIGRTFTASLLAAVTDQPVETIEARLSEAHGGQLIASDQEDTFSFRHETIREYLYDELGASRRQRLHEAVGRTLEAQSQTQDARNLSNLAYHLVRSGDRARGALASRRAAEQALRAYAAAEAVAQYHVALDLLDPDDRRRGDWLLRLGEAAQLAGDVSDAAAAYEAAQAWWLQAGSPRAAAQAAHGLGQAQWRLGALPAAQASFEAALTLLQDRAVPEAVHAELSLVTLLGVQMGQQTAGLVHGQRALKLARQLRDRSLEAAAGSRLGNLLVQGHEIPAGVALLEQALALAVAQGDPAEAGRCCAWLAEAYFTTAEIERSHEAGRRREEFARQCHDPLLLHRAHSWRALLYTGQGAWEDAERLVAQAETAAEQTAGGLVLAFLHQVKGWLSYQRGDYARAETEIRTALASYRDRDPGNRARCLGALGILLLAASKLQEAQDCIAELEALLVSLSTGNLLSGWNLSAGMALCFLARMAVVLDDRERTERYYPRLLAFQGEYCGFLVDRVLAEIEIRQGNWLAAGAHLTQAETTAGRAGLQPELARILADRADWELAQGGPGSATRARNFLGRAQDLFQSLGMDVEARAVRDQFRTLPHQPGAASHPTFPSGLTEREAAVLRLVAIGKTNRQIAEELYLSEKTVANHLTGIFTKTGVDNRAGAANFALRHGLA